MLPVHYQSLFANSALIFFKCVNRQDSLNRKKKQKRFRIIRAKTVSTFSFDLDAEVQHKTGICHAISQYSKLFDGGLICVLFDSSCCLGFFSFHSSLNANAIDQMTQSGQLVSFFYVQLHFIKERKNQLCGKIVGPKQSKMHVDVDRRHAVPTTV